MAQGHATQWQHQWASHRPIPWGWQSQPSLPPRACARRLCLNAALQQPVASPSGPQVAGSHAFQHSSQPSALPLGPAQLLGPGLLRPRTTGRCASPVKLAALSAVLRLPVKDVQELVARSPQLLQLSDEQLTHHLQQLQVELSFSAHRARSAIVHQPHVVLPLAQSGQLVATAQQLATALGLPLGDVTSACSSAPSLLKRPAADIVRQLTGMTAALGGTTSLRNMLRLAAQAPQFLTDSPASVARRLAEFAVVLHKQPQVVVNKLSQQPDLLFMSVRVLRNKFKVLCAILDRHARLVCELVMACPALLRTDMDNVRAVFTALPHLVGRDQRFAYAMVCHSPHLLLEHPPSLAMQAAHLGRVCQACSSWSAQQLRFSPAQVADCLGRATPTYVRLSYLVASGKANTISLHSSIMLPNKAFVARFPNTASGLQQAAASAGKAGMAKAVARAQHKAAQELIWQGQPPRKHYERAAAAAPMSAHSAHRHSRPSQGMAAAARPYSAHSGMRSQWSEDEEEQWQADEAQWQADEAAQWEDEESSYKPPQRPAASAPHKVLYPPCHSSYRQQQAESHSHPNFRQQADEFRENQQPIEQHAPGWPLPPPYTSDHAAGRAAPSHVNGNAAVLNSHPYPLPGSPHTVPSQNGHHVASQDPQLLPLNSPSNQAAHLEQAPPWWAGGGQEQPGQGQELMHTAAVHAMSLSDAGEGPLIAAVDSRHELDPLLDPQVHYRGKHSLLPVR